MGGLIGEVNYAHSGLFPQFNKYTIPKNGYIEIRTYNSCFLIGLVGYAGGFILNITAESIEEVAVGILKTKLNISFSRISTYLTRISSSYQGNIDVYIANLDAKIIGGL